MPKSRNRTRTASRPVQQHKRQRKWVKWLALLLPVALLGGTLLGIFGTGAAASQTGTAPIGTYAR